MLIAEAADEDASEDENEDTAKKVLRYDGATLQEANELITKVTTWPQICFHGITPV